LRVSNRKTAAKLGRRVWGKRATKVGFKPPGTGAKR
jgi:hypothetical protein